MGLLVLAHTQLQKLSLIRMQQQNHASPRRAWTHRFILLLQNIWAHLLLKVPKMEIKNTEVNRLFRTCKSKAIIYWFNGFWPWLEDLDQWIHTNWTTNCEYYLCSKGFFIVQFFSRANYKRIFLWRVVVLGKGWTFYYPMVSMIRFVHDDCFKNASLGLDSKSSGAV